MTTRPICLLALLLAACGSDGIAVPEGAAAPDACASCTAGTGGTLVTDASPFKADAPIGAPADGATGQVDTGRPVEASTGSGGSGGSLTDACAACADAQPEASPGTGGNAQTGGSTGSGGATGTGGLTGSGGIVDAGSGGSAETGGATSTGGTTGTGGATQPPPEFPGPDGGGTWLDWPFCIDVVNEPDAGCCRNIPYGTYMHTLHCAPGVIPPHPPCWQAVGTTYVCDQHR